MPQFKLLVLGGVESFGMEYLRSRLPLNFTLTDNIRDADFILGGIDRIARLSPQELDILSEKVKLIHVTSAGYDNIDIRALAEREIPLATNDGGNSVSVAEHVFMLVLALYRQLITHDNSLSAGRYTLGPLIERFELINKTVGILGLGRIGTEVAKRLKPFNVRLVYHDIYRMESLERELGITYLPFDELLRVSDIVTIHVPLTDETRNMIDDKALELMKPTAILINTARGSIIDEQALYRALKERRIAGAGIDVWEEEGLLRQGKRKSPLWELDNIVATPHIAGQTYDTAFRRVDLALANFVRVANGEAPRSVVLRMQCPECSYIWDALNHRLHEAQCPKCGTLGLPLYKSRQGLQSS